jgi:hypothetical protein
MPSIEHVIVYHIVVYCWIRFCLAQRASYRRTLLPSVGISHMKCVALGKKLCVKVSSLSSPLVRNCVNQLKVSLP